MNLRKKDLLGASDPYVKLKLSEDRAPSKKTHVKHRNLNPEWNQEFTISVRDPESQVLELVVYDWEKVTMHIKSSQVWGLIILLQGLENVLHILDNRKGCLGTISLSLDCS